jgi:hypothetical protein
MFRTDQVEYLFQGKALPGSSEAGMSQQGRAVVYVEEAVQQAGVAEKNLRGLDLALADVFIASWGPSLKISFFLFSKT